MAAPQQCLTTGLCLPNVGVGCDHFSVIYNFLPVYLGPLEALALYLLPNHWHIKVLNIIDRF